jgi:DNA (cytosine-5)-methyltransferase 1
MNVLDLFSGIGGFSLGLERAGMTTVAFCEVDPWCRRVLAKHWPDVPCFDDVRTLKGEDVGSVQLICGGYPCQPFSQAGKREGTDDDRHLWPEMHRLVASVRPRWVIAENVAGHISMGLDSVLSDLEGEGYTCWPLVIPACAVDAPHRRDRVWIVANAAVAGGETRGGHGVGVGYGSCGDEGQLEGSRRQEHVANAEGERWDGRGWAVSCAPGSGQKTGHAVRGDQGREAMADAAVAGRKEQRQPIGLAFDGVERGSRWLPEPGVGRVAHGIPKRVDRLKGLGNSVVPQIPEMIGRAIMAVGA